MGEWATLISALSTVVLVGVTWWYARTTKEMASTSARAAEAARDAALASQRAAEAAEAGVDVDFSLRPYTRSIASHAMSIEEHVECYLVAVLLRCEGAAVYVHSAHLDSYSDSPADEDYRGSAVHTEGWTLAVGVPNDFDTVRWGSDSLPHRMHKGEELCFLVSGRRIDAGKEWIDTLEATVYYSLNGEGQGRARKVSSHVPHPFRKRG